MIASPDVKSRAQSARYLSAISPNPKAERRRHLRWKQDFAGWRGLALGVVCLAAQGGAQSSDTGWPRTMTTTNQNQVELFQPQLENWRDNHLQARAVVEVTLSGDPHPHLGVAWFTADTVVDKAQGLVTLENVAVTRTKFSALAQEEADMPTAVSYTHLRAHETPE